MKQKYLEALMDMTERFGLTSEATRLKVGASIVKNGTIISLGVNGTYSGWHTNVCEQADGTTSAFTRHAEAAALDKLVTSTESARDAIMLISHAPCLQCSLRIREAGIRNIYYRHQYRDNSGVQYLQDNDVVVEQI